jgi:hypothetical protein
MSPRELLGSDWWDKQRQEAYKRAKYHCQCCGVPKTEAKYHQWLEAHETYIYDYATGTATVNEIVALCHSCHNYIHSGRLRALYQAGKITSQRYADIIDHGDRILANAGLQPPDSPVDVAKWTDWKIIIDGKVFPTRWKSFEEWQNHYS